MRTKMDKGIKRTALVFLSATTLSIAVVGGAYAGATIEEVKAYFNKGIKVNIDGKETSFKDGDGNAVYPLIQNGSSYFPARALTNALGGEIDWNDDTNTITITTAVYGKTPKNANPYKDAKEYQGPDSNTHVPIKSVVRLPMIELQNKVDAIILDSYNKTITDKEMYSVDYLEKNEIKKRGESYQDKYALNRAQIVDIEYYPKNEHLSIQVKSDMYDLGPEESPYTNPQPRSHDFTLIMEKDFTGSYVLASKSSYKLAD